MTFYVGGKKLARQGISTAGGGVLLDPAASTFLFGGAKVSLDNDSITPHGTGTHASSHTIANANTTFYINSIKVVLDGDSTTCSHAIVA